MKIAIIGCGNVGGALARRIFSSGLSSGRELFLYERDPSQCQALSKEFDCYTANLPDDKLNECDVICLSVKPQDSMKACEAISAALEGDKVVITFMAGITTSTLKSSISMVESFVRAMPNLPFTVNEGISGVFYQDGISNTKRNSADRILRLLGEIVIVNDEALMDVITAVSASGPGFLSYLIDALINATCAQGFDRAQAMHLVLQTLKGTVKLLEVEAIEPGELIRRVATKGGTTEAAIKVLSDADINGIVSMAINSATQRGKELSR